MSKPAAPIQRTNPPAPATPGPKKLGGIVVVGLVVVIAAVVFWQWKSPPSGTAPVPASPPATQTTPAVTAAPAVAVAKPEYQKLKGRWQRPDGGYVIEIKSVTDAGAMDAAYFNPNPIHVAKANASLADATIRVFIELRDVNYPGATYTLAYDPANDQLNGIYYQPLQQQSYEISFVRMN